MKNTLSFLGSAIVLFYWREIEKIDDVIMHGIEVKKEEEFFRGLLSLPHLKMMYMNIIMKFSVY